MSAGTVNNLDAIASLPFGSLSSPEAGEQIRDSLIAEIRDLRAERDRLASLLDTERATERRLIEIGERQLARAEAAEALVEKLRPWVSCAKCGWTDGDARNPAHQGCDMCEPLADLLAETETP